MGNETQVISNKSVEELKQKVHATQLDLETKDAGTLYKNSRALRMKAEALQAAEYEKFMDSLVRLADVEWIISVRTNQFRDGMEKCVHRIAPEIAGKTNIAEVESL